MKKLKKEPWLPADVKQLKTLTRARKRVNGRMEPTMREIAKKLKRTEGAVRQKLFEQHLTCNGAPLKHSFAA